MGWICYWVLFPFYLLMIGLFFTPISFVWCMWMRYILGTASLWKILQMKPDNSIFPPRELENSLSCLGMRKYWWRIKKTLKMVPVIESPSYRGFELLGSHCASNYKETKPGILSKVHGIHGAYYHTIFQVVFFCIIIFKLEKKINYGYILPKFLYIALINQN